jgi:hypothetical protein
MKRTIQGRFMAIASIASISIAGGMPKVLIPPFLDMAKPLRENRYSEPYIPFQI